MRDSTAAQGRGLKGGPGGGLDCFLTTCKSLILLGKCSITSDMMYYVNLVSSVFNDLQAMVG